MAKIRKIVEIDEELCDGCGLCALACAEGALEIRDGKARIVKESYCDGLGACLSGCPQGAVKIIERKADEFDPEAVEEHLESRKTNIEEDEGKTEKPAHLPSPCACPSSRIETFPVASPHPLHEKRFTPDQTGEFASQLSHWPIQLRLVPPNAPFLKHAHLLVVSDCAPVAYPNFHREFVGGKAVLMGCPKFDNAQEYAARFAEIFRVADIQSVTVIDMEVPCCSAMPALVRKGMKDAGKDIPIEEVVIGLRGNILRRENAA
ncbi:MAG: 4Fe-4S binding protein [Syntrophobacter sp.]